MTSRCLFCLLSTPGGYDMIVFISDLHIGAAVPLLPGVGQSMTPSQRSLAPLQLQLPAGAVEGFYDDISRLARDAGAKKVTLVLLGDIFDFIQTRVWLNRSKGAPQAWRHGDPEEDQVAEVMARIVWDNRAFFRAVSGRQSLSWEDEEGIAQEIQLERVYIPGNHDRLCNKHPRVRRFVDRVLGLHRSVADAPFDWQLNDSEHAVLARHGHVFDGENFAGRALTDPGHLLTPVGDLLTVEIASTLPDRMTSILESFGRPPSPEITAGLKRDLEAMFSVPGFSALTWFWKRVVRRWRGGKCFIAAVWALAALLWRFARRCLRLPRWFGRSWGQNVLWALRSAIVVSVVAALPLIAALMCWRVSALAIPLGRVLTDGARAIGAEVCALLLLWGPVIVRNPDRWLRKGARDDAKRSMKLAPDCVRYIVYGHTHHALQELLTVCPDGRPIYYLNTGTWRQVIDLAGDNSDFASYKTLSYVVVYGQAEQEKRLRDGQPRQYFEGWAGKLRDEECF